MALNHLFLIFLGGGMGASARFALSTWINNQNQSPNTFSFPWAIFSCNLIGCLLIGLLYGWLKSHHPEWIHPLFITGLFGGFTTFSSFALDTQILLQNHAYLLAASYAIGSIVLGLLLCFIGFTLTS
ncbi:fluoride efflux transporter CrcB [Rubritalea tangerina]|uniref:Fluoride-specific ion channel FluC n=1 Tax=Rubritalea tangerina TaxID=430798 RepID=A0ABW4Z7X4_9BACT